MTGVFSRARDTRAGVPARILLFRYFLHKLVVVYLYLRYLYSIKGGFAVERPVEGLYANGCTHYTYTLQYRGRVDCVVGHDTIPWLQPVVLERQVDGAPKRNDAKVLFDGECQLCSQ